MCGYASFLKNEQEVIMTASAQSQLSEQDVPPILGTPRLLLQQKLQSVSIPSAAAGAQASRIVAGGGYATIGYSVGTNAQRNNLAAWIRWLASALPSTIGNSTGTYVVNLRIKGEGNNLNILEPIISIQWTTERAFLFFDKTVNDVGKTQWLGTLCDEMRITEINKKLQFSVEISFHKDRSLDFEFLKQASKTGSAGSLLSLLALPAASLPILDAVTSLISNFYANSTSENVVNSEEIEVTTNFGKTMDLTIQASDQIVRIPVNLDVSVKNSRLVEGGLVTGKFDKTKISETLFETAQVVITPGKTISLAELLVTSSDERAKRTRGFLDALQTGAPYIKDDLAVRCGDLVAAMDSFVSKSDARAVFWAFLHRYANQIDRNKALGSGTLGPELIDLGLSF
jgi:hypothetical protein